MLSITQLPAKLLKAALGYLKQYCIILESNDVVQILQSNKKEIFKNVWDPDRTTKVVDQYLYS